MYFREFSCVCHNGYMHFHSQSIGLEGLKLNQIGHFCHDFARKRGLHVTLLVVMGVGDGRVLSRWHH